MKLERISRQTSSRAGHALCVLSAGSTGRQPRCNLSKTSGLINLFPAASLALASLVTGPASAAIIFSDDFEGRPGLMLGAPPAFPTNVWEEDEGAANDVALGSHNLFLRESESLAVVRASITASTLGYENIVLSYQWRATERRSDFRDIFNVTTGGFGNLSHRLSTDGGTEVIALSSLASNLPELAIAFSLRIDRDRFEGDREGVGIFYVTLTGDPIRPAAVPEPASWSMLILGFASLGAVVRRRASRQAGASA